MLKGEIQDCGVYRFTIEDGVKGDKGLSAYEVAVQEGFSGTEQEWLESLVGPPVPVAQELGDDPDLAVSQKLLKESIDSMEQSNSEAVAEAERLNNLSQQAASSAAESELNASASAESANSSALSADQSASKSEASAELAAEKATETELNATRAETARDAAFVNADVYPDVAAGLAAVADGEQFQVLSDEGLEYKRYRKDSATEATEVGEGFPTPKQVEGAVQQAENAAARAETARDAAFVNADVYPDVATGRAAVANGEQFQVVEGDEIIRYRRDSSSTYTLVARYPSARAIQELSVFYGANEFTNNGFILSSGRFFSSEAFRATDFLEVLGGHYYTIKADADPSGSSRHAWYDKDKVFISSFEGAVNEVMTVKAPETARYLRVSTHRSYADKSYVSGDGVSIRGVVGVMSQHPEVISEVVDKKTTPFLRNDSIRVPLTEDQDEYIFAVLDQNRKMTDLAVRKSDGQVPDWVIDRWRVRLNIAPPEMAHIVYADIPYTPGSDVMPVYANRKQIAGWGSSSIEGMYLVLGSYASSVGAEYFQEGRGIERAEHSFARLGSRPALLTFKGNTVPASGTVEVECSNVAPSIYMKHFEGEVGGVVGTLSVLTAGVFSFARKEAGEPVYVEPDSPFIPTVGTELRNAVTLLWAGKNDLAGNLTPPEDIIKMTDQAFEYHAALHKRVLVLTHFVNSDVPPVSATRNRIQMVNDQIRRQYGAACIDVDLYLRSEQLWVDTGITPTPEDLAQQAAGNKPMSVSLDNGHLSSIGNQAVMNNLIAPRLSELGWYNMGEQ